MSSLARFPYRLLVEFGETSKWEVQETGKASEPPNSKTFGFGHVTHPQFPPAIKSANFLLISLPTPRPAFPFSPSSYEPRAANNPN